MNIKQYTNYNSNGEITFDSPVNKIGFCCEPKGIGSSIIIRNDNGSIQTIVIGKTGMIEYQPEDFKDANDPEAIVEKVIPSISSVVIPSGFK